jgi:hypothetical protein
MLFICWIMQCLNSSFLGYAYVGNVIQFIGAVAYYCHTIPLSLPCIK